jgi:hypothetical protein
MGRNQSLQGAVILALWLDLSGTIHDLDDGDALGVGDGQLGVVCGDCPSI